MLDDVRVSIKRSQLEKGCLYTRSVRTMATVKVKEGLGRLEKWVTFENVFKAVVILVVWGLLSIPVAVYFAKKEQSTSSDWLDSVSMLLQSLEGNCDVGQESGFNGTNGTLAQNCSNFDNALQVSCA